MFDDRETSGGVLADEQFLEHGPELLTCPHCGLRCAEGADTCPSNPDNITCWGCGRADCQGHGEDCPDFLPCEDCAACHEGAHLYCERPSFPGGDRC